MVIDFNFSYAINKQIAEICFILGKIWLCWNFPNDFYKDKK